MCITTNLLLHLFCIHRFRDICFPIFQTLILSWYHQATFKKFVFAGATSCFNFNLILFRCRMLFTKNQSRHYYFLINHAFDLVLNPGGLFLIVNCLFNGVSGVSKCCMKVHNSYLPLSYQSYTNGSPGSTPWGDRTTFRKCPKIAVAPLSAIRGNSNLNTSRCVGTRWSMLPALGSGTQGSIRVLIHCRSHTHVRVPPV